jgi:hypothetical protein
MPQQRRLTPGYTVIFPNRDKAASKVIKLIVVLILLASVVLMLAVTVGGWSKLQGLKAINFVWCFIYVVIAFYVARWKRGLLPIAAALGILLLIVAVIAGLGATGTSWFDRNAAGFAPAQSLFGGKGLTPDVLGTLTLIIAPVQALLILFAMQGFAQGWNVELEVPIEEARKRGYNPSEHEPAPAKEAGLRRGFRPLERYSGGMGDAGRKTPPAARKSRSTWRLTPAGWVFGILLVGLIVLAIVSPSRGIFIGLIAVIFFVALLLNASYPSGRVRGMYFRDPGIGRTDLGSEAAERYDRERGIR